MSAEGAVKVRSREVPVMHETAKPPRKPAWLRVPPESRPDSNPPLADPSEPCGVQAFPGFEKRHVEAVNAAEAHGREGQL